MRGGPGRGVLEMRMTTIAVTLHTMWWWFCARQCSKHFAYSFHPSPKPEEVVTIITHLANEETVAQTGKVTWLRHLSAASSKVVTTIVLLFWSMKTTRGRL